MTPPITTASDAACPAAAYSPTNRPQVRRRTSHDRKTVQGRMTSRVLRDAPEKET
jgi:hypothetical protein